MDKLDLQIVPINTRRKGKHSASIPTGNKLIKTKVWYTQSPEYDKTFYVVIDDIHYYVYNLIDVYFKSTIIYSTPANDIHPTWTIRHRLPHKVSRPEVSLLYWSPLKEGLIIRGYCLNENDFIITHLKGKRI